MPDINIDDVKSFGRDVSFGKTAVDYGKYRHGFPDKFFDRMVDIGWIHQKMNALDLGSGTGTVARGLARAGLSVLATDPAVELLEEAKRIDSELGIPNIIYAPGIAENIDANPKAFDVVVAGQCWHWFDRDKAAQEVYRVLKASGRIIIAHFDWLPLPKTCVSATEELILKYNPRWAMSGGSGIYPAWLTDLAIARFQSIETFSFDIDIPYSHEAWRGRIRASAGVKATLSPDEVSLFDEELAELLHRHFADPLCIQHRVWATSGVKE